MVKFVSKWTNDELASAMQNAVYQNSDRRFIKAVDKKIMFNAFWRNGDRQNICLWLDKATWFDMRNKEGGRCKEFAETAFNLSLPDFMAQYGHSFVKVASTIALKKTTPIKLSKSVHQIWTQLQQKDVQKADNAARWLIEQRGFENPRFHIGSGFCNLDSSDVPLFEPQHHSLIKQRISLGSQIIAPLRSVHSEQVKNLFFRATTNVSKDEKSRLLTGAGGWSEPDGTPRAFGFPNLIPDFPNLILCEGMADYFAAECLLRENEKYLPIGASNAAALMMWAEYLARIKYAGQVIVVYQLDSSHDGSVSVKEIGPSKAIEAMRIFKDSGIKANLFNWLLYIENTTTQPSKINDLADSLSLESINRECGQNHLNECFLFCL